MKSIIGIHKKNPIVALILNLVLLYPIYTFTRLQFVLCNQNLYSDHLSFTYLMSMVKAGLRFDTTTIIYLNFFMIIGFLFPCHIKERKTLYYKIIRILFIITNSIGIISNLIDCVYYPFVGRRTTWNVLQEFCHEGNIFTIIIHECAPYWYLFLIAAFLIFVMWHYFVTPEEHFYTRKSLFSYYLRQTLVLPISIILCIGGIRGGFTMAVRPITLSNANQYVTKPVDAAIVLNTPFCIIRTIGKKAFSEMNYLSDDIAQSLFYPLHVPQDTASFRPLNVVILILESFGKQSMIKGYMPFVESLCKEGMSFEYSYACGRKSIDGMPSVLSSIPSFVEPFFLTPASLNDLSGIAGELTRNKQYHSAFFHGAENGSMGFQAFANATGFEEYYGRTEYNADPRYHGDKDFDGTWAIWDEEFLQFFCDKMSEMEEPFVTSVFTASSHSPFQIPERYKDCFPETTPKLFGVTAYSDNAVRLFFEKAKRKPWFGNTLFVLTADHTSESVDPEYLNELGVFKVPIIFYSPRLPELHGIDSAKIVSQADIMPTVLGILNYDHPYVAFGQDVLHTDADNTFAVNYLPGNDQYQYLQGDWLLQFDGNKVVHAYRFKKDSLLEHDLVGLHPVHYEDRLKSIIQQYMQRMNNNDLIIK